MHLMRPAASNEATQLSNLALISKAHWGYSEEFMEQCRDELTIDPADCDSGLVNVCEDNGTILGFYRLSGEAPQGVLEDLFVEPTYIGNGVGTELLQHAIKTARNLGMAALEIDSDPNAEGFYLGMGAKRIGTVTSSSIAGRFLPKLLLEIQA